MTPKHDPPEPRRHAAGALESGANLWTYDPAVRVLRFRLPGGFGPITYSDGPAAAGVYEVDPETPNGGPLTTGRVLGCIAHVAAKKWATPEVVGDLVVALDAVLDLQAIWIRRPGGPGMGGHRMT